ncbi:hypothetical protein [Streptomyces aidingensis]|uniref:Uncharacterized protein n=1 Tax=Streptomyces aidingensis TaxID=910347 RepID=A0A1I1U2E4_9ACTN|nr:hypothetical protein [Streptomyces aidingensis]SFD64874.1 hypothetical protein SAMN05421773_12251 [Streptomyces aidingensis]
MADNAAQDKDGTAQNKNDNFDLSLPLPEEGGVVFVAAGLCALLLALIYPGAMTYALVDYRSWPTRRRSSLRRPSPLSR